MKAVAVLPGTRDSLHVRDDAPEPHPAEGEVLVRVLEAGICGTDAEIHQGLYGTAPAGSSFLILGHENLGVVEAAPAESGLSEGDLVVATVRRGCPEGCRACVSDQNDMCLTGHFLERGIGGLHGFMCESYCESPRYLIRLAPGLRAVGVLLEPMSIVQKGIEQALRIQQRVAWEPRKAVVIGAGPIGILAALALRLRGLEVHVASLGPATSARARLLAQADIRYVSTAAVPLNQLPSVIGTIDLVFEATGAAAVVFDSMRLLGPNGICILSSVTPAGKTLDTDVGAWNREMVLGNKLAFGTVNAGRRHFEAGARDLLAAQALYPGWLARLITRRMPFGEAKRALTREPDGVKTVLEFA
jgi:threonine dehydrogenase-like Zn-dependent dehydrogenase